MNQQQRILLPIIAIALAGLFMVLLGTGAGGDAVEVFLGIALFTILNPLFWIIFLIVVLSRGRGGQQQQQQVVIVTAGGSQAAPRLRCPKCKGLSPDSARFCGHCGAGLA